MSDGFAFKKYFADNGALIGLERARRIAKEKNSLRSLKLRESANVSAPSIIPKFRSMNLDHAAEVLLRIADKPGGRVGGHHDQRHTESHLIAPYGYASIGGGS